MHRCDSRQCHPKLFFVECSKCCVDGRGAAQEANVSCCLITSRIMDAAGQKNECDHKGQEDGHQAAILSESNHKEAKGEDSPGEV